MKSLAELLAAWEQGPLTPEELAELKRHLGSPEARAELVDDWLLDEALYDASRAEAAEVAAPVATPAARPAQAAVAPGRRWFPRLIWRELRIPVRWPLGFGLGLCLLLLGLNLYYQQAPVGRLETVQGAVVIERAGRSLPAAGGQALYPSDILRVPPAGAAALSWADEATRVEVAPGTDLQVLNPWRGKRFILRDGGLQAAVAPQPRWRPLTIRTPQAEARIVGTIFSLSSTGAATRLEVLEGAVRLRQTRTTAAETVREVLVQAGEKAAVAPNTPLKVQLLTGFLSSDLWTVPPGTGLAEAPSRGRPVAASQRLAALQAGGCVERLRGYLYPKETGAFTFWVASFNGAAPAELWLSRDDKPAHKERIAFMGGGGAGAGSNGAGRRSGSGALDLDWSPSQKSAPQPLVAGGRYYIEVWHAGGDIGSLAIRWRTPGEAERAQPRLVDLDALCPFVDKGGSGAGAE